MITAKYKYDIAISLCKQDVDFARKLVKAINPNLKIFFYEDRQDDLISKCGPEVFANTFKEESRIVIILSRKEWSESYYTDIERNAIIDRTSVQNEGYHFLMVIPMVQGEIPSWYPSTHIYASPAKFSIEQLAHFIEFKVTEKGGIVKPLTVEERYQYLLDRIEVKKSIINLQHDQTAVENAEEEMNRFKNCFNSKIDFFNKSIIDKVSSEQFSLTFHRAYFNIGNYFLTCIFPFHNNDFWYRIFTTQDVLVEFELSQISGGDKKIIESEQWVFYYTTQLKGWGQPVPHESPTNKEEQVLFRQRNNSAFYDLINITTTDVLVDMWFQLLLEKSTETIEKYI